MADATTPNKRCHNCRRQRLRCDRSYPHCNKCVLAGKECLGYGQLFRWTGAIASRGKLAGKTSMAAAEPAASAAVHKRDAAPPPSPSSSSSSSSSASSPASSPAPPAEKKTTAAGKVQTNGNDWILLPGGDNDNSSLAVIRTVDVTERVCRDLVTHDIPEINPFRNLIPLTRDNPLVQHIIVAAAAAHRSNVIQLDLSPAVRRSMMQLPSTDDSRRALRDSLVAKQKALRLMREAVQNIDSVGVDVVLAASLFFVNVELIESGKHGWKAHLEGAGRVMSMLGPADGAISELRDYMLSDCFIYFVMASAFTPATSTVQCYFESSQIPLIIERATINSYLCAPPEILAIIYAAAQLSNVKTTDEEMASQVAAEGLELLSRTDAVDVASWASNVLNVPYLRDKPLSSRINAGLAHRLAASLYIVQAIQPVRDVVGSSMADDLSEALYQQLCSIPADDPNFKSTSWPIFIYGGGAKSAERRAWVMDRLDKQVRLVPWGFFYTAMETLQIIWKLDAPEDDKRSWVDTLKDPSLNFLMV
ncbi:GAL4 [Geosmithia morbida]|uniref:GAL4 n=1 Tax=Geosmithia morbida TaxID=1094350 RepID=A0A9P5D7D0_9HYPO|nr:GAL4 [Geosmithia morbida]KAF4124399.1 GAL4 [Geosmithia morbida]